MEPPSSTVDAPGLHLQSSVPSGWFWRWIFVNTADALHLNMIAHPIQRGLFQHAIQLKPSVWDPHEYLSRASTPTPNAPTRRIQQETGIILAIRNTIPHTQTKWQSTNGGGYIIHWLWICTCVVIQYQISCTKTYAKWVLGGTRYRTHLESWYQFILSWENGQSAVHTQAYYNKLRGNIQIQWRVVKMGRN